jgi:hypothetical protein
MSESCQPPILAVWQRRFSNKFSVPFKLKIMQQQITVRKETFQTLETNELPQALSRYCFVDTSGNVLSARKMQQLIDEKQDLQNVEIALSTVSRTLVTRGVQFETLLIYVGLPTNTRKVEKYSIRTIAAFASVPVYYTAIEHRQMPASPRFFATAN